MALSRSGAAVGTLARGWAPGRSPARSVHGVWSGPAALLALVRTRLGTAGRGAEAQARPGACRATACRGDGSRRSSWSFRWWRGRRWLAGQDRAGDLGPARDGRHRTTRIPLHTAYRDPALPRPRGVAERSELDPQIALRRTRTRRLWAGSPPAGRADGGRVRRVSPRAHHHARHGGVSLVAIAPGVSLFPDPRRVMVEHQRTTCRSGLRGSAPGARAGAAPVARGGRRS